MPLQYRHTSSVADNYADPVPVSKLPTTPMPYPLEKLESNVAQTWSSLELLSQDFAQMWDQIEKLESIMSLQRRIISTVNPPMSYNTPPLDSSSSIHLYGSAMLDTNTKPSSSCERPQQPQQFLHSIPSPSLTPSKIDLPNSENTTHYSWSEFFNIPSVNDTSIESSLQFEECIQPVPNQPSSVEAADHRNDLNKGEIPAIRFQIYCDVDDTVTSDNNSGCPSRFKPNVDSRTASNPPINFSGAENDPFDESPFNYTGTFQKTNNTGVTLDGYSAPKKDSVQSSPTFYTTSYYLPKSHSSLSLDNAYQNELLYQPSSTHTYYSPQPKRRSASSSSKPSRVGYSCPILDSSTNLNTLSPSSSNSYVSRATECSSLPHSDYCSPIESRYTNPFLCDSFNDVRIEGETVDRLIGESNFIIRPADHVISQFENVINVLDQYQAEPSPPDSPPPPAPQDNRNFFYQRANSYDEYFHCDDNMHYEYVEPISSTETTLDTIDDSDPEDIISKINHMYENEFQRGKTDHLHSTWSTPQTIPDHYQSQINDETLDLIDRLQENMELRNALASSKYKSWTNIQQNHSPYELSVPLGLAQCPALLPAMPDKSPNRYKSAGPDQFQLSRLSTHPFSGMAASSTYGGSMYDFKGSRKRFQTTSADQQTYVVPPVPYEGGSHISSVYSLAGTGSDQYTTVFTSGVPALQLTRPRTPDLLGGERQRTLDKYEMAKNFPTHSYKPDDAPPSIQSTNSRIISHPCLPIIQHQRNDFTTCAVPLSTPNHHQRLQDQAQFTSVDTASSAHSNTTASIAHRRIFETKTNSHPIPGDSEAKRKSQEPKKNRRGTLRSAFSTVGTSVSHWIPNLHHLAQRRHSFPTPSPMSDEFCTTSTTTSSPKKKKHSIISVMTGIFHKSHKSNSFNASDDSDSMVAWNNMVINQHNHEDVFIEPTYRNQFPDLTKGIKNVPTYAQASPLPTASSKRSSLGMGESKSPPLTLNIDDVLQLDQQKRSSSGIDEEENPDLAYEMAETPTLAQPIINEALAARYATNPTIAIDSFEENEICDIEDDHSIATTDSKTPEASVTPKRYALPKQFSLDVSPGFQNDDCKEDSKSNHSWCSAMSKTSSRRQSTEESIDTEDEWYMYECRKLENMEQQNSLEKDTPSIGTFDERVEAVLDSRDYSTGKVIDELKFDLEVWQEEPKLEEIADDSVETNEFADNVVAEVTYRESPVKDSPNLLADESDTISLLPIAEDNDEERYEIKQVSPTDETEVTDEYTAILTEDLVLETAKDEVELKNDRESRVGSEELEDRMPGTPSLPRFRYDKSESGESPHASKEEISKDGLGSKWKLLKALKERKAEEKSKEAEPAPPAVSISNIFSYSINIFFSFI